MRKVGPYPNRPALLGGGARFGSVTPLPFFRDGLSETGPPMSAIANLSIYPSAPAIPPERDPRVPPNDVTGNPGHPLPVTILGVTFDPLTLPDAVDRIEQMVDRRQPRYVVTPNVDFLVQAKHDAELHRVLANADLVLCDGKPLVWASQWLGNTLPARVAGSDLTPLLLQRAEERGWRIFILGGGAGVAADAARRIAATHPFLPAIDYYSPPHGSLAEMNHEEIIRRVRVTKPDLVFVCFGCPKQEKWIFQHYRALGVPVAIGLGGTVDFLAGRIRRAPGWMRRTGMEWLFRLLQEPRRLMRRYATNLLYFFPALVAQRLNLPPAASRKSKMPAAACAMTSYGLKVEAADQFNHEGLRDASDFWTRAVEQSGHCVLDLAAVKSIDSTGLAFLTHWQRRLARARRNLILFRPSLPVRTALAQMRLTGQFVINYGGSFGARFSGFGDQHLKVQPGGDR